MKQDDVLREIGWTTKRVLRLVPKNRAVEKSDFQAILDEILRCLRRNRKTSIDEIAGKTHKILTEPAQGIWPTS